MSRIVIIGGSGHIGSYLLPVLVERGHHVINVSRGIATPYRDHVAWNAIEHVTADRTTEEKNEQFGTRIAALDPDVVVDLICFHVASAQQLVDALRGRVEHYLFCSSTWVYGKFFSVPSTEADPPNPIDSYGTNKAEIEAWLVRQARLTGFPATCFRPGHIVGAGWPPINPLGNANPNVFSAIARGDELVLPNLGLELLHHVHADDVAQWITRAIEHRSATIGEVFNTVSEQAVTMRGYAETVYQWFGKTPRLAFRPFDEWMLNLDATDAEVSRGHVIRSSCHSIEKSRQRLGYAPRYSSFQAIHESVAALIAAGRIVASTSGR